jgi:hypothetical protein
MGAFSDAAFKLLKDISCDDPHEKRIMNVLALPITIMTGQRTVTVPPSVIKGTYSGITPALPQAWGLRAGTHLENPNTR